MKVHSNSKLGRRSFLRALGTGAALATSVPLATSAVAQTENSDEKRKSRYKADSPDVKAFYRVNHYPS